MEHRFMSEQEYPLIAGKRILTEAKDLIRDIVKNVNLPPIVFILLHNEFGSFFATARIDKESGGINLGGKTFDNFSERIPEKDILEILSENFERKVPVVRTHEVLERLKSQGTTRRVRPGRYTFTASTGLLDVYTTREKNEKS